MTKNDFPIDNEGNSVNITEPPPPDPEDVQVEKNRQRYLAAERQRWQRRKA